MKNRVVFCVFLFLGMLFGLSVCPAQEQNLERPWYETTYRWAQTNFTEDDPASVDLEFWKSQWKRTRIQGVIINCGGIVAYYPSKFELQYRAKHLGDRDFFKDVADAAREQGIKVVARMDINRATREFYQARPDWFARNKNGNPIMAGDRYVSCINSGYYKEFIPQVLTEIIERYQPVGFTDNSWKGTDQNTICYCDNCKKRFKADRDKELPEKVSWDDPVYREWLRWGYACRLENWDLFNETTQRVGGKDCLWFGMVHGDPRGGMFVDLKGVLSRSKMVFCDHQGREGMGFEQNAVNGSLLRFASHEQALVPESMANYVRGNAFFRLSANPKEETRLWMLTGIAGGISPWFHHVGGGQNDRRQFETPVPIFQWHEKNEQNLYERTDMANVGLVWSQANADFFGRGDVWRRVSLPWKGFCQALSRHGIPFLPINSQDIKKYSPRLKTLILPHIAVLTDDEIDAVCEFLDNGGNLVLSGTTATRDFDGEPSKNDKLWKRLGLVPKNEFRGSGGHNYLRLPQGERHEILAGFEDTDILPFGGSIWMVESNGPLKPIASHIPGFPSFPPEFSWIREEEPNTHPFWGGTLDTGGRVVYLAGDMDRCFGSSGLPDQAALLANTVRWASNDTIPFGIEGIGYIDCKIYKKENRLIIHLVNLSGADRRGYLDFLLPAGPFTVTLDTFGLSPSTAKRTVAGDTIPIRIENGKAVLTIDKIVDHEMLIIE